MKPKTMVAIKSDSEYLKSNKMAINKSQKRIIAGSGIEGATRNTVLVNSCTLPQQRGVITNTRAVSQKMNQDLRCKRKISFIPGQSYPGTQPASVARRNARERNRVKQVNNGFATLRSHIPPSVAAALSTEKPSSRSSSNKKLSKVETLKMAVEYIRSLQEMLDESKGAQYNNENYEEDYYSSSPESSSNQTSAVSQPEMIIQHEYYTRYPKHDVDEYYERKYPKSEPEEYDLELYNTSPQGSPKLESPKQFRQYDKNPNGTITILNTAAPTYSHSFAQPRQRNSSSLSPPISEACPSPTPSYASDNSSIHTGSLISSSSGHVTSAFSRLTTGYNVSENVFPSPASRQAASPPHAIVTSTVQTPTQYQKHSPGYENYEPMSPEDEELLDVISWWQQSH